MRFALSGVDSHPRGSIADREPAAGADQVDEAQTSAEMRQRLTRTVCHELAHMWFGNLVTMSWWTDLWLNEVRGSPRLRAFWSWRGKP